MCCVGIGGGGRPVLRVKDYSEGGGEGWVVLDSYCSLTFGLWVLGVEVDRGFSAADTGGEGGVGGVWGWISVDCRLSGVGGVGRLGIFVLDVVTEGGVND